MLSQALSVQTFLEQLKLKIHWTWSRSPERFLLTEPNHAAWFSISTLPQTPYGSRLQMVICYTRTHIHSTSKSAINHIHSTLKSTFIPHQTHEQNAKPCNHNATNSSWLKNSWNLRISPTPNNRSYKQKWKEIQNEELKTP